MNENAERGIEKLRHSPFQTSLQNYFKKRRKCESGLKRAGHLDQSKMFFMLRNVPLSKHVVLAHCLS